MSDAGLAAALERMRADGVPEFALAVFEHRYRELAAGATGLIPEDSIEPVQDLPHLSDLDVSADAARSALGATAVIKLNGGLATSMGLDRAKSLVPVRDGRSFLELIVAQLDHLRAESGAGLPLLFMDSFRTAADTLAALERLGVTGSADLPADFLQSSQPKLWEADLTPVRWPPRPELELCPPGHADVYPALASSGVLDALLAADHRYAFISNADNLGAVPDARIPAWMAANDVPFVLESTRRTAADRKGGHLAVRRSDGRLVLRESVQTAPADLPAMHDVERHPFCNTNNLWLDLRALRRMLDATGGLVEVPLIRNVKPVDPADPATPKVVQLEGAMGAAVQAFDGARSVLVDRDRFLPVKTTNDLLLLRSDQFETRPDARVVRSSRRTTEHDTFVDLDERYYRSLADFDRRFPAGPPSLRRCTRLVVRGDVTFEAERELVGDVVIDAG